MIGTTWAAALSPEHRMIHEAFGDFLRREARISLVRATASGFDESLWQRFVGTGGVDAGTSSEDLVAAVLIGFEAGRTLAPIPYVDAVSAARVASTVGLDLPELDGRAPVTVVVRRADLGYRWCAAGAILDAAIVLDDDGAELYVVEARGQRRARANLGRLPMARVTLDGARRVDRVGLPPAVLPAWRSSHRLLSAALLAGAARAALGLTCDYVKERQQFGRPIGAFQAVQHRLADSISELEAAEHLVLSAAEHVASARSAALALRYTSSTAQKIARDAVQLFGGYGVSLEYDIHLYLRFVKAWRVLSADCSLDRDCVAWGAHAGTTTEGRIA
jgi:3-oxochol-4-en-24-oyl-CoA dehydrogenase